SNEQIQLHVSVGAISGLTRGQVPGVQAALVSWIRDTASNLPVAPYGRYITPIRTVMPPGVPFPVSLHRLAAPPPMRGRFHVLHIAPHDLEGARRERIRRACDDKFPKLAVWKRDCCARTVLVLEDNDIQLTNDQRVYEALIRVEEGRADRPDEIYVV